jgi:hypothetical protein
MISKQLKTKTFSHFNRFKNEAHVVSPSLPILYFGDLRAYESSPLKIVTVGKNPSLNEFRLRATDDYSFVRFPLWNENTQNLEEALNPYFETQPLKQWFSAFEPILNGLGSSYYQGAHPNISLHTDLCSPLATSPTWSLLGSQEKKALYSEGIELWKQLISELQPDVILVSVPEHLYVSIFQPEKEELIAFQEKKNGEARKQAYRVWKSSFKLNTKSAKVIFGQAANKPFDTISAEQKIEIGKACLR